MQWKWRLLGMLVGVAAFAGAGLGVWHDYQHEPRLVIGPMVQAVEDDSLTLLWSIHPNRPTHVSVREVDGLESRFHTLEQPNAEMAGLPAYSLRLDGLKPHAQYAYTISCDRPDGRRRQFVYSETTTAPQRDDPFRIVAFGDSGTGSFAQRQLGKLMWKYRPDIAIHTGDVVYNRGEAADYPLKFFSPYAPMLERIPFYATAGNHDVRTEAARPMLETFIFPENGPSDVMPERHYWFDFGNVRFICIDANEHHPFYEDVIAPWLEDVLADAGSRWTMVFFHDPIYTTGRYTPAVKIRDPLVPLFDKYGVDLVLCGHNHMYERTYPLRDEEVVELGEGTVYVTTGAGGARLYAVEKPIQPYMARWHDATHSFTLIDVTQDQLTLRQIDLFDNSIDTCFIPREHNESAQPARHSE